MATRNVTTDTNYSSLTFVDGDIINIDNLAILTIDTNTLKIAGVTFGSNGAGIVRITNSSTTTPIFVSLSGSFTLPRDATLETLGNLIEIGTGDGSTVTFNLPTGAGGSKYSELGACWVDRGDTFRDSTPYKRTYGHVSSLTDKLSSHTFGDVFTQDTTANTITFLKPVPNGCKIYVPNIQIKGTDAVNSQIGSSFAGTLNLNYTSLSKIVNFYHNGGLDTKINYCGFGFCQTTIASFSDCRRMVGGVTITNTGFNFNSYYNLNGCGVASVFKNVFFISTGHSSAINVAAQSQNLYIEKFTGIYDVNDLGDPVNNNITQPFLILGASNAKTYDVNIASISRPLDIFTNNSIYNNILLLPTGTLASCFSRNITNVTNNGSGLIRITVNSTFNLANGFYVKISGVNGVSAANGTWRVKSISTTQFDLDGSVFSGSYISGGTAKSYSNGNRICINMYEQAKSNIFTNISAIPSPDALLLDPSSLQRFSYFINSTTGNSRNTFDSCTFSLKTINSNVLPFTERGSYNRYNNFNIIDSSDSGYAVKLNSLDQESYGNTITNWTYASASNVAVGSSNGTNTYTATKMERILLDTVSPSTDFGYNFSYTPVDAPSILAYTNTNKTKGRVFALPSLSGSIVSLIPSPSNIGPYSVKEGKVYLKNTGDIFSIETLSYGGITGINMFGAREQSMTAILSADTASNIDNAYQYAVSMRRPSGNYTKPLRIYGSRLTAATSQASFYNVGNTVAQVIAPSLTAYGVVDFISGTELRIKNITTSSDVSNPNYLWGHFLDNNLSLNGTLSGINNLTTNYFPVSNLFTNQYDYLPSSSITQLNSSLTSLPIDSTNSVQFKFYVIRDTKDYSTDTFDQRFYGANIDVDLDPNYVVTFNVQEASITCPNIISGSRIQIYNVTKNIELDNKILLSNGYTKTYDLFGNVVNVGDTIRLRVTKNLGLSAYSPIEVLGSMTDSGLTFPQTLSLDDIYLENNIDGSSIAGITLSPDYTNIQIDLSDNTPPYQVTAQQIYNYYIYLLSSEQGIRNFYGAITPIDRMNYQINSSIVPLKIQNTGSTDVVISGGRLFRDDNVSIIDTGVGAGTGSLMHDTGFLVQFIQPQVENAISGVGGLATNSDMQTVKTDVSTIKKKTNLISALI